MTPEEFVQCFRREKAQLLETYVGPSSETSVAQRLYTLGLSPAQIAGIRGVLDMVLTDAFYTTLLALDGCTSLGGVQQNYTVHAEDGGSVCCGDGSVEALAYDYFYGHRNG